MRLAPRSCCRRRLHGLPNLRIRNRGDGESLQVPARINRGRFDGVDWGGEEAT